MYSWNTKTTLRYLIIYRDGKYFELIATDWDDLLLQLKSSYISTGKHPVSLQQLK